ncbi:MAG TPA: endopeptidase [Xanthomonadaceae bacterium]|nr:endopeptidase [Xanthomonadaceae bacterium]
MKIVFIHGRRQEGKLSEKLKNEWCDALKEAFRKAGHDPQLLGDVAFPYYGDALFAQTQRESRESFRTLVDKGAAQAGPSSAVEQEFIAKLVMNMARQRGITDTEIAEEAGVSQEKGVLNWPAVLAALRLLNKLPGVASGSIELFTRDVWCYLTQKGARMEINDLVDETIPTHDPCIVVAHSLGSVVAYNVLMNRKERANVALLVTLGSPLGIPEIYDRLPSDAKPRRAPAGVHEWFNARDAHDVVALYEIGASNFGGDPKVRNYNNVRNGSENHHGIAEYLSDPEVVTTIARVVG